MLVEHQLVAGDVGVRQRVRRLRDAVPVVAELPVGRFLGGRGAGAAAVLDLVVALEQVLELVRGVQRVVQLAADVIDDRLVVVEAVPHAVEIVVGDRAGQRAEALRVGVRGALRALARIVVVQDGGVDVLVIGVAPEPQLVLA